MMSHLIVSSGHLIKITTGGGSRVECFHCLILLFFFLINLFLFRYTGAFSGLVYLFALPALTKMEMQRRKGLY